MNLTTALAQQPVTRLQRIVASWRLAFDGPITSKQQLAELLAKHIGNSRVISSLPQLDRGCLALLYHLAGLPQQNTLSRQQVAAIYGKRLPPDEVWQITARLAAAGVLLPVDNDAYYLPSSVRQAFLGDAHSMQLLLGRLNLTQLRSIALKLGVTAAGQWKQDEVLAALHGLLVDPKTLADVRAELSPEAQLILAEALRTQGRPPLQALLRPLPPERRNVVAGQWSWYGHEYGRASNGLVELQQYGLLFPIYSGWGSTVAMPTEVRWALESNEQSLPHLLSPCLQSYQGNDFVAHPSWPADAVRALVFLEQQRPARLKSGGFSKQALRKLAQGLTIQQPEYAGFIISFLLWSGAAVVRQQTFAPVPDADRWLRSLAVAPTDVARELWLTNPYWLEASDNPLTLDYFYGASLLLPLRMAVFELVATIPPGGATTATFLDLLDFQQPTSTASAPPGAVVDMLRAMQWLGLLELAGEPLAGLRPAARARLATKDAPAYASTKFVVQPNLEIVAPPDLELTLLRCLLRFTDGAAATGATVARLTQDSLRRGVESKLDADAMLGFLADHSSTPIPQTVQHFVRDVAGTYGQVQIGPAEFYLRANSPQLMQKILSTRAAANLLQPLTDTVALVDARDRAKLVTILRQGGHMPLVLEPEAPASQSLPVQLATLNDVRRPFTSKLPAPDWDHLRELERYQQPAMPPPAPPRRDGPRQEPLFQRSGFGTPSGDSVA